MKKKLSLVVPLILALATVLALGACGGAQPQKADDGKAKTETTQAKVETGTYEGTLLTAYKNQMVLSGKDGDMEFQTDKKTVYKMGDVDAMYLDDKLSVKYHVDGKVKYVDEVSVVEHQEPALEFAGELVHFDDDSVTLSNSKLTVTFQTDSDTYIVGDFSRGDGIELTYYGDLSEYPYADVIAVVDEASEAEKVTAHGIVSELTGGTLLLGIDSAHAYRFAVTDDTKVSGAANDVAVGDRVDITYKGNIKNIPDALNVNVTSRAKGRASVVNGKVATVAKNSITVDTGKAKYSFGTNDDTKYYGDKPADGLRTEVTYTGNLDDNPQAGVVYCVKSAAAAKKKPAKKKEAQSSKTSSSAGKKESDTSKKDSEATQKDSAAEQQSTSEQKAKPEKNTEPKANSKPANENKSDTESDSGTKDESGAVDEDESADEPKSDTDDQEGGSDDTDSGDVDQDEDSDGEPASTEQADVNVSGKGTIVKIDEDAKTMQIELKDGTKATLSYDGDTKISSGYTPEKGDEVKVVYGSDSSMLKDVQLINKTADPDDEDTDSDAESEEDEGEE